MFFVSISMMMTASEAETQTADVMMFIDFVAIFTMITILISISICRCNFIV